MDILDSASQRDKVKRLIVDPLKGRGEPPKGWTPDALAADYILALARYPEHVLSAAADRVRTTNKRNTWPLPGEFKAACDALSDETDKPHPSDPLAEATRISTEAWAYVSRRMSAADGALLIRTIRLGIDRDIKRSLFVAACACIRENREAKVSNTDLESWISELEAESTARLRSRAEVMNGGFGRSLGGIIRDRAKLVPVSNPDRELISDDRMREPPPASEADYGDTPEPQRQPAIEDDPKVDDDILEIPTDEEIPA